MPNHACQVCGRISPAAFCDEHKPDHRSPSSKVTGTRRWRERTKPSVLRKGARCHYCGAKATAVDHVQAVANGGAPHERSNLVPCCSRCNAEKGAR